MILAMTYNEFKRQLGKAGLSVKSFAELIKQNPNSITNYAAQGDVPPHLAIIAALMGHMADHALDYRVALSQVHFEASKPRGSSVKGKFGGIKQTDLRIP
ncbi:DNA-binding protein [Candidatus Saccharibacteria bacterium]|nr:DNA-binding protein [Candidatus Saccharibacteria bacterium]|tara:strand:- start:585 stop:884 length:300 start_codon:yes stop_codon:yes gene_type:complete